MKLMCPLSKTTPSLLPTSNNASDGSTHDPYRSTSGAFNGTGITALQILDSSGTTQSYNLFYQDFQGQIHVLKEVDGQIWKPAFTGDITPSAGPPPKNGTPMAAVNYTSGDIMTVGGI